MDSFVPAPPPLFDRFRERRTTGQRVRRTAWTANRARQRALLFGARVKHRVTR